MFAHTPPAEHNVLAALAILTEAKAALVATDGIGSELAPALIAYDGTHPIGYTLLTEPPLTPTGIYRRIGEATGLLIAGWHATGIALALESFAETATPFTDTTSNLAERFATDHNIQEAIWVAYADQLGNDAMGVITYQQTVGRKVHFDEPTLSRTDQHQHFQQQGTYPHLLRTTIKHIEHRPIPTMATRHQARQAIAGQLERIGWTVHLPDPTPPHTTD
jgi:hypothetical protein